MAIVRRGLNAEQKAAVISDSSRCLVSCPGSGKTRTIVEKTLQCIEEIRGTPRRVGCITYTNAAVFEIETRLLSASSYGDQIHYEISTIHSFCLNNILRPYQALLEELEAGLEILSPQQDAFQEIALSVVEDYGIERWAIDSFSGIQPEPDGTLFTPDGIGDEAALAFVDRVHSAGYITLGDIVYYSCLLCWRRSFVSRGVGSRYAWILVDEFQDTSACQVEVLKSIYLSKRTKLFIVGDPNQSIFGFAGAKPNLMKEFADYVGARTDVKLVGNYRCSKKIVQAAERLCPTKPAMKAVGMDRDYPFEPRLRHVATKLQGIWEVFLPKVQKLGIPLGETAVLAPQWFPLYHLGSILRDLKVPIMGPGARPYRRSLEFAQFAETACAYLQEKSPETAAAVQKSLFFMLLNTTGDPESKVFSYEGKKTLFRLLSLARALRLKSESAIDWLKEFAEETASLLVAEEYLAADQTAVIRDSALKMAESIQSNIKDVEKLTVDYLGLFARPRECLRLLTMHGSKGREFDAVAIIDVHDDKVPHWTADTVEEADEARRLLYVAATRARKVLMIFTDSSDYRNVPSRFLGPTGLGLK